MVTNYDDIADVYLKAAVHPIKKYGEAFTLLKVMGNVKAKSVLDLAGGHHQKYVPRESPRPFELCPLSVPAGREEKVKMDFTTPLVYLSYTFRRL